MRNSMQSANQYKGANIQRHKDNLIIQMKTLAKLSHTLLQAKEQCCSHYRQTSCRARSVKLGVNGIGATTAAAMNLNVLDIVLDERKVGGLFQYGDMLR